MPTKVEDNAGIRESLTLVNGSPGFQSGAAYPNVEIALKQMPLDWPDVVLIDINLPQMSGMECVAQLKKLRPRLPVIMLTVYVDGKKSSSRCRLARAVI